jgi:hypothetical protein
MSVISPAELPPTPDCTGIERWPAAMALVHLQNAGLTSIDAVDPALTGVERLASERIGADLFRQVHRITFTEHGGHSIEVVTVNDASSEECSMTGVEAFVVAKRLGKR